MNNKKPISILQISLMVIAIFAFAFTLNGAFVSAEVPSDRTQTTETQVSPYNTQCGDGKCEGLETKRLCPQDCDPDYYGQYFSQETNDKSSQLLRNAGEASLPLVLNEGYKVTKNLIKNGLPSSATTTTSSSSSTVLTGPGAIVENTVVQEGINIAAGTPIKEVGSAYTGVGHAIISIASVLAIAAAAGVLARVIAPGAGASISQSQTLGYITAGSTLAALLAGNTFGVLGTGGGIFGTTLTASSSGLAAFFGTTAGAGIIGVGVAAILMVAFYKKEPVEVVQYQCLAWQPERGGDNCELCNDNEDGLPCTEYQCKSLGAGCEIINKGTEEETCYYSYRLDVEPPVINVNKQEYDPTEIALINYSDSSFPEDRGVKIKVKNKDSICFSPFENIKIAVTMDEPSICKYSFFRDSSYDEMPPVYFSNGLAGYNHSTSFNLPGKDAIEAENLSFFEGLNNVFVRCEDPNGNKNIANYVFDFCVDETPDLTEPVILETNPSTESYLPFDTTSIEATFFVDKPADCKWDHFDMSYEDMANTMSCTGSTGDATTLNQRMVYPCTTTLTGIQNYEPNDFYISCKSYPEKEEVERMEMGQAYKYTLIGTRPLGISSVSPNDTTIVDSAEVIKVNLEVETIEGALEDGTAVCQYSISGNDKDLVTFFNTNSYQHSQELFLEEGNYNIRIKCTDIGGNVAEGFARFEVDTDTEPPIVARAYYENNKIVLVTTENATCTYNTKSCDQSYVDSIEITTNDNVNHYLAWDTEQDLFIKCQDVYENRPGPGVCNIVVRGHELYPITEPNEE